jgi:hypothetical protein
VVVLLGIRHRFRDHASHSNSPSGCCFTSRQPISSGALTSAGRQKKEWRKCWEAVVAMGVAVGRSSDDRWRMGDNGGTHTSPLRRCQKSNSRRL